MKNNAFNAKSKELAAAFNISESLVRKWVNCEVLKQGKHYIDIRKPNAHNAMLRFDIEACQQLFLIPPEKR